MDNNDDDAWLISSLERYEQLFMYELTTPIQQLNLSFDNEGVWTRGVHGPDKTELSLLMLPGKIINKEVAGSRDFKIAAGAIVPYHVIYMQQLAEQLIVSNANGRTLHWWNRDTSNPDLLVEQSSQFISCPFSDTLINISIIDWLPTSPAHLLLGTQRPGLAQLYDNRSQIVLWEKVLGEELHCLSYYGNQYQCVSCQGSSGKVHLYDTRVQPSCSLTSKMTGAETFFTLTITPSTFITLSNTGLLKIYDPRSLDTPLSCVSIATTKPSPTTTCLSVQSSPDNKNLISVSGLCQGVDIYDINHFVSDSVTPPTPLFTHDAHESTVRVLTHIWHSTIPRLLLSAGNDGSLHAWQYNI